MLRAVRVLVVLIGFMLLAHISQAGQFELLSRAGDLSDTATGIGSLAIDQRAPAVSADGRWIAFTSSVVNLAAGQKDLNGTHDVFLHDRQAGTTVLVSHAAGSPTTAASGGGSFPTSISDDGRWVVYQSTADDLVPGQVVANTSDQIVLYDRDTGTNTLVSHSTAGPAVTGNGQSSAPRISGDGNWVAFESGASDLVAGDGPQNFWDVFLYERATGQTTLVSRTSASATAGAGAGGWYPEISPDGAAVVFPSDATDLVPGQTDLADTWDLFLFDRASGTNLLVSHAPGSPATSAGAGEMPGNFQVAQGGAWVVFLRWEAQGSQIHLFRRSDSSVTLVSRSTAGPAQGADDYSLSPSITPDGAFVAFDSRATDLVPGQSGPPTFNVYLYDRAAGTLALASGSGGSGQVAGNGPSDAPAVSADGSVVAWYTWATDLGIGARGAATATDLNGTVDVALYDRSTAATALATLHAPGQASATASEASTLLSASADGRYAVFLSTAVNAVPGQVNRNDQNVFLVDRVAGTTTLVSRAAGLSATTTGDGDALDAAISADGAFVAFVSRGRDHVAGQIDTNVEYHEYLGSLPGPDVFLYDRAAGTTTLVSHAAGSSVTAGEYPCVSEVSLSADGRYVAFGCVADDLVAGQDDANLEQDVFLYDRVAGTTVLVSRKAGTAATTGDGPSISPVLGGDGRWVAFASYAADLVAGATDANNAPDVFLFDRISGQTLLVSRAAGTAATAANQYSQEPALSADGRYVVFTSAAVDLVPGQSGPANLNLFLFDRVTGVVELISRRAGTATTTVEGAGQGSVSDDGRYVAFLSTGSLLVPGQSAGLGAAKSNVFVHDRVTRQTELISRSVLSPSRTSDNHADRPTLSPDGRYVAFVSRASDLAPGATGRDVYLADRQLRTLERIAEGPGPYYDPSYTATSVIPRLSADGGVLLFTSGAVDLAPGDWNGANDVFARVPAPPSTGDFFTVAPCRLIDTRQAGQGPALVDGVPARVDVHGVCGGTVHVIVDVSGYFH